MAKSPQPSSSSHSSSSPSSWPGSSGAAERFAEIRSTGTTDLLDGVWERTGLPSVLRGAFGGDRSATALERAVFAASAGVAVELSEGVALEDWLARDVAIKGLPRDHAGAVDRASSALSAEPARSAVSTHLRDRFARTGAIHVGPVGNTGFDLAVTSTGVPFRQDHSPLAVHLGGDVVAFNPAAPDARPKLVHEFEVAELIYESEPEWLHPFVGFAQLLLRHVERKTRVSWQTVVSALDRVRVVRLDDGTLWTTGLDQHQRKLFRACRVEPRPWAASGGPRWT